jgi:hypothetical protein
MTPRRFRIAFSFAGEKRDFVAQVAAILANKFPATEILFAKYPEAQLAGDELGINLAGLHDEPATIRTLLRTLFAGRWWSPKIDKGSAPYGQHAGWFPSVDFLSS